MTSLFDSLWPPPRRVHAQPGACTLGVAFGFDPGPFAALAAPDGARIAEGDAASVRLRREADLPPGGYRLAIRPDGVRAAARDEGGARAALATLAQILRLARRVPAAPPIADVASVPCVEIDDHPDFPVRGALLDVSRGRVPRMPELSGIAARLAEWKYNHLQLYVEHAFAYRGHEEVWRDASPLTPADLRALDARGAALGIDVAPNQQSFGHFHRWLKHARYRDLAEVPEGVEHAFSLDREPYSLCLGDPRALALLADLYDQLLPCLRSEHFNVGLDETFDLGLGRSRAACAERGTERVYLEYLREVHALVTARGKRMQFWGDVILKRPELVPELPRDLVALEWGYDAGHPFAEHGGHFARSGLEWWVCPGTSSWQSFAGRPWNALGNQHEAAVHGRAHGARGYLVTDWGDRGHHQPHCVRDWGLFAAAGPAWNADVRLDAPQLARLLDLHVYQDAAGELGAAALELGDADRATGSPATNGAALFFLLAFAPEPFPHARTPGLTRDGLLAARAAAQAALARLGRARSARPDAADVVAELRWAGDMLVWCADLGLARLGAGPGAPLEALPARERRELADRLAGLTRRHREGWLRRDRPGGLEESTRWFERVRPALAGA